MAEEEAARVVVRGRVQGVFFRAETRQTARSLGLAGWVRNLPDGSVEAWFEGDGPSVDRAVEWSRHGPPMSRVDVLEVTREDPGGLEGFEIRY